MRRLAIVGYEKREEDDDDYGSEHGAGWGSASV
jgi:hypothetical protein